MRKIIDGKIYNTETMAVLACHHCYSNGNYIGSNKLCRTRTGLLALVRTSNGQDLYRCNTIEALTADEVAVAVDGWELTGEEQRNLSDYVQEI